MEQDLEIIENEALEPYPIKYSLAHPPPDDRCGALSFSCKNPECDFLYDQDDRETLECPICHTQRKVCGSYPRKGINNSSRCKYHGGAVPMGVQNAKFKGRSISHHLPTRLAQIAGLVSREDKLEMLSFQSDVELLEIRKIDLLNRLDTPDSKQIWHKLNKTMRQYRKLENSFKSGKVIDGKKMLEKLDEIESIIISGSRDYMIWQELSLVMEQGRKLKESELKKRKEESTTISEDDARALVVSFLNIIKTRVLDQDIRSAVLNDMNSMLMVK